jgi:hypothetical protein
MNIINDILKILIFETSSKNSVRVRLEDAIKNRLPVSFFYKGPPNDVLAGRRIKVELVASGLTKKGNLAVRGYVQPPSVSKKGFEKHGWRTFLVSRIAPGSLNIYNDEQFNEKRPNYQEGDDSSFSVTYVKSDWGRQIEPKKEKPIPQEPIKTDEPTNSSELPQPKKQKKPERIVNIDKENESDVIKQLQTKVKVDNNQKYVTPEDFVNSVGELFKKKMVNWVETQKQMGLNYRPGEGTRRKFEKESETEMFNSLNQNNIKVIDIKDNEVVSDDEVVNNDLQEQIKRFKTLISPNK